MNTRQVQSSEQVIIFSSPPKHSLFNTKWEEKLQKVLLNSSDGQELKRSCNLNNSYSFIQSTKSTKVSIKWEFTTNNWIFKSIIFLLENYFCERKFQSIFVSLVTINKLIYRCFEVTWQQIFFYKLNDNRIKATLSENGE